jgi:tight adherence protein B
VLLPFLVFAFVLLTVFGAYWALVLRAERAKDAAFRQRLTRPKAAKAARVVLVKEVERLSGIPAIQNLLTHRQDLIKPVRKLVEQSGVRTTIGVVVLSSALLAAIGFLAGQWFLRFAWVGLILAGIAGCIPAGVLVNIRNRRIAKFEELFPEAIDLLSRALKAGHAFTTALGMVAEELPQPIAGEFRLLYDRQNYGLPLGEALRDFAERVPLLDARFFVTAVLTQRESGGNLSEVLDNLASVIRERFTLKREVRVKSAHGRATGYILAGLPPALAAIFMVTSPDYLGVLFHDPAGIRMLITGIGLQIIGTLVIRRLVRIDY